MWCKNCNFSDHEELDLLEDVQGTIISEFRPPGATSMKKVSNDELEDEKFSIYLGGIQK